MPYSEANVRPAVLQDAHAIAQIHVESSKTTYKGIFSERLLGRLSVEDRARSWNETLTTPEPKLVTLVGAMKPTELWDSFAVVPKGQVGWDVMVSFTRFICFRSRNDKASE